MEERMQNYLYGMHPEIEAVRSGKTIEKVLLKQGLEGPQYRELMEVLKGKGIPVQFVPAERLARIARGGAHQGVAAYVSQLEAVSVEDLVNNALAQHDAPIFMILDGVSDVRNLGAIARTLECAGGSGIILPAKGGAPLNADAVKTSAGALMRLDVCRVPNLKYAAYYLKQNGFRLIAATEKGDYDYTQANYEAPVCIVMGAEDKGISYDNLALCDEWVRIPMFGSIESLNVSAAAAVC